MYRVKVGGFGFPMREEEKRDGFDFNNEYSERDRRGTGAEEKEN